MRRIGRDREKSCLMRTSNEEEESVDSFIRSGSAETYGKVGEPVVVLV